MNFNIKKIQMSKRMRNMLIILGVVFGLIIAYKIFGSIMLRIALASAVQTTPVSVMKAGFSEWQPKVTSVGSLRAIRGVNVTTELAGMVQKIYFEPGSVVDAGTLLVQLNADAEIGQLQSLEAQAALAKITYERDKNQYSVQAISKQTLDADYQNLRSLEGQVAQQAATVAKKSIRAPFSGKLGINNVNLGQYINTGDVIVSLQTLDPIWADFYVPQQKLALLKVGMKVVLTCDSLPGKKFTGVITTINPAVEVDTRNVTVEATIQNPKNELTPGTFVSVDVDTGQPKRLITLPQTAVSYNPYGDIVYIVREKGKDKKGKPMLTASQKFVITGETRGEQVAILKGLNGGETIVTSGQLKLKNNSQVTINNKTAPSDNPAPVVKNDH